MAGSQRAKFESAGVGCTRRLHGCFDHTSAACHHIGYRDRYARYSEEGADYVDNMQRLLKKFETAKDLVPAPVEQRSKHPTRCGVLYFGSTTPSMHEALEGLAAEGIHLDTLRIRAFPFADTDS